MPITTTAILSPQVQRSYDERILSTPTSAFIYKELADLAVLPQGGGNTLIRTRYNNLDAATVPLGNSGVTPASQSLDAVNVAATIEWYGTWVEINEQVMLTRQDRVLNNAAKRLGVSMRKTEDILTRDMLLASAARVNCEGGVNGDGPTEITRYDIDEVVRGLADSDALTVLEGQKGVDAFGTSPVRASYFAMGTTKLIGQLDRCDGFKQVSEYPTPDKVLVSEYGSIGALRFMLSSNGLVENNSSLLGEDVYFISCAGMESYGCIDLEGGNAKFIYHPPELNGPLELNATAGWKMAEAPVLLNDAWIVNLCCTAF